MKDFTSQFGQDIKNCFTEWLKTRKEDRRLIRELQIIERAIRKTEKGKDKGMWIRFFSNDTAATTIREIERLIDTSQTTLRNYQYVIDCMEISVQPDSGLKVYFS